MALRVLNPSVKLSLIPSFPSFLPSVFIFCSVLPLFSLCLFFSLLMNVHLWCRVLEQNYLTFECLYIIISFCFLLVLPCISSSPSSMLPVDTIQSTGQITCPFFTLFLSILHLPSLSVLPLVNFLLTDSFLFNLPHACCISLRVFFYPPAKISIPLSSILFILSLAGILLSSAVSLFFKHISFPFTF